MTKTVILIGVTILLVFLGVSQWSTIERLVETERLVATGEFPIVGEVAPDFSLPELSGGSDTLKDHLGEPLVIAFWTTWCKVCKKAFPLFETFYHSYAGQVTFLSICAGDSREKASGIIKKHELTFPVLYDEGKVIARAYQPQPESAKHAITVFPFTVFIDSAGVVVQARAGNFSTLEELLDLLRRLDFPVDQP